MNAHPLKNWRDALASLKPSKAPVPAEAFWTEFRRRASRVEQALALSAPRHPLPRWGLAAACALVLLAAALPVWRRTGDRAETSVIHSVEVIASHRAVLIMKDDVHRAAILWVVGLNETAENRTLP